MNSGLPDVQAGFRKDKGTRDQIANICWIIKKARDTILEMEITLTGVNVSNKRGTSTTQLAVFPVSVVS